MEAEAANIPGVGELTEISLCGTQATEQPTLYLAQSATEFPTAFAEIYTAVCSPDTVLIGHDIGRTMQHIVLHSRASMLVWPTWAIRQRTLTPSARMVDLSTLFWSSDEADLIAPLRVAELLHRPAHYVMRGEDSRQSYDRLNHAMAIARRLMVD